MAYFVVLPFFSVLLVVLQRTLLDLVFGGRIGIEVPVEESPPDAAGGPPARPKREKRPQGLPMPTMPDEAEVAR